MDETEKNFLQAWAEFQWPDPPKIFYRLYHDNTGKPLIYTMEDLPGQYIEITKEEFFLASMDCKIIDGKIIRCSRTNTSKLVPSDSGTTCHPNSVAVVVNPSQPHQKWEYQNYE